MAQDTPCVEYKSVTTDSGHWCHAEGEDYLFFFADKNLEGKALEVLTKAIEDARAIFTKIKKAAKDTTGNNVTDNAYVGNHQAVVKAMNAIDGMAETSVIDQQETGTGTAVEINMQFFEAMLAGLNRNDTTITKFLVESMGKVQAQAKKIHHGEDFGTVIGLVSLMPVVNVPFTTFKYAYISEETKKWFVRVNCGSTAQHSYDYSYTAVDFSYVKPDTLKK